MPRVVSNQCTIRELAAGTWDWNVEAVADPTWSTTAWGHDVLVTVEETEVGALKALFDKAAFTSRRG